MVKRLKNSDKQDSEKRLKNSDKQVFWLFRNLDEGERYLRFFGYVIIAAYSGMAILMATVWQYHNSFATSGIETQAEIIATIEREDCEDCYDARYRYRYYDQGEYHDVEGTVQFIERKSHLFLSDGRIIVTFMANEPEKHMLGKPIPPNNSAIVFLRYCSSGGLLIGIYCVVRGFAAKRQYDRKEKSKTEDEVKEKL